MSGFDCLMSRFTQLMNYVDPKKPDLAYDAPLMIAGAPPKATTNIRSHLLYTQ